MKKMSFRQLLIAVLLFVGVSGCSILSPVEVDPPSTYVLNAVPDHVPQRPIHRQTILVAMPEARPGLNTTQMAYTTQQFKTAYFGQNQWAETPPQMLLPVMVQTLQDTHYFHAVMAPPVAGQYDYLLSTEITQLDQDFTMHPARLQFTLRVQLTRIATNKVIATKQFTVYQPIMELKPYSGVVAANEAVAKVMKQLALFVMANC